MDFIKLYLQRLGCIWHLWGSAPISLITAWRVACAIHPIEDLTKWWLGTGWMGPKLKNWYVCETYSVTYSESSQNQIVS
jgi:hypothetical protein